jgi:hypothetical protein
LQESNCLLASADSTPIARVHAGNNTRNSPAKGVRRAADELDGRQCAPRYGRTGAQPELHGWD